MLTLMIGRGKTGKTRMLLERVKECPANTMASRIVIVPEQLSHMTERRLAALCGDEISFVSEVLSFTRLYNRVCSLYGGAARASLDAVGRLLTARLSLDSIRHQLKVFASTAGRAAFLGGMVEMIDELKSYDITPEILSKTAGETGGLFSQKLSELALILGTYDAHIARGAMDPRDHLTLLKNMLRENDYARERYFFVDGFTDFSAQELGVLRELLRSCREMTVTVPCDDPAAGEDLFTPGRETLRRLLDMAASCGVKARIVTADYQRELPGCLTYLEQNLFRYSAPEFDGDAPQISLNCLRDKLEECRRCGAVLKKHAMEGIRYRDMLVATGDTSGYGGLLETVFRSMGIPVYRTEKRDILSHPAASFVLLALEAALDNLETETVTACLKTGYCNVTRDDCDAIENYALTWRIRGSKWLSPWRMHPEGYDGQLTPEIEEELTELCGKRDQALGPIVRLRSALRSAENLLGQMTAIYEFLEETRLCDRLEKEMEENVREGQQERAQETAQIYGILLECLRQISGVLGKTNPTGDELLRILKISLGQYQVGTIPAVLDAVQFGSVEQVRGSEPKILYVLGCNEGVLPSAVAGGSLLTEQERGILRDNFSIHLAPDSEGNMERQLLTIYSALTAPTEQLYVSCCQNSGNDQLQPSFIYRRLEKLFPSCGEISTFETEYTMDSAAQAYLSQDGSPEKAALAAAISRAAQELGSLAEAIAFGRDAARERDQVVSRGLSETLFGSPVSLTASRLDQLGKCPLNFFLNYGLKARVRKEATFNASEFGTFIHYILEKTVKLLSDKGTITPIDREESTRLIESHLQEYAENRMGREEQTNRQKYLFDRNGEEAAALLEDISHELSISDFHPEAFELQFGGRDMPPVEVEGRLGKGKLSGFVDRADVWHGEDGDYLRVVDYKSGTKSFDYTEIYGGVGMQMLLYLFAMKDQSTAPVIPAGVLYVPAKHPFKAGEPDEEASEMILKRSGVVLDDEQVLEAMEHGEKFRYLPVKNGNKGRGDYAISEKQMRNLEDFVEKKMAGAVDQVLSGDFAPSPFYRGINQNPCRYCDYVSVCQKDQSFRRSHYVEDLTADEFWEKLGGEKCE